MSTSVGDRACIPGPERSWHKTATKSVAGSSVGQFNDINFNGIKFDDIMFNDVKFDDIKFNDVKSNDINFNDVKSNDINFNDVKSNTIKFNDVKSNDMGLSMPFQTKKKKSLMT